MILNMLENIPHECSIIKDCVRDVPVAWVPKGLPLLHLILCLLRGMSCADKGPLPGGDSARAELSTYNKGLPAVLERTG